MLLAGLILLSCLLVALVSVGERHGVGWVQSTWTHLATYANAGVLYPVVYHGHVFGTRFMAIPVIFHAAAARMTGKI